MYHDGDDYYRRRPRPHGGSSSHTGLVIVLVVAILAGLAIAITGLVLAIRARDRADDLQDELDALQEFLSPHGCDGPGVGYVLTNNATTGVSLVWPFALAGPNDDPAVPGPYRVVANASSAAPLQLGAGEHLLGIAARPNAAYALYAVTNASRLVRLGGFNHAARTVVATALTVVGGLAPPSGGLVVTADRHYLALSFNPVVDRLRVVDGAAPPNNFRVNPNTGLVVGNDTTPTYDPADPVAPGAEARVASAAYTPRAANGTTVLYTLVHDAPLNETATALFTQGAPSPNDGVQRRVGALTHQPASAAERRNHLAISDADVALVRLTYGRTTIALRTLALANAGVGTTARTLVADAGATESAGLAIDPTGSCPQQ